MNATSLPRAVLSLAATSAEYDVKAEDSTLNGPGAAALLAGDAELKRLELLVEVERLLTESHPDMPYSDRWRLAYIETGRVMRDAYARARGGDDV